MAKWSATRRARFNYRKYEKPGRKYSDKQRAAYWKKKYLSLYNRVDWKHVRKE